MHFIYGFELLSVALVLGFCVRRLAVTAAEDSIKHSIRSRLAPSLGVFASLFLLTYSGCSAAAVDEHKYRPATDILHLSLPELGWIALFGILPVLALTVIPLLKRLRFWQRTTAVLSSGPFILLSGFGLWANGCNQGCQRLEPPTESPGGRYSAHVEELDGGAADSFHTTVIVRSANHLHSGVVFTSSLWGPRDIHLQWTGPEALRVTYTYSFASDLAADHQLSCHDMGPVRVSCDPVYVPPIKEAEPARSPSPTSAHHP